MAPPGIGLHHRRLDLEEVHGVEVAAQELHDPRAAPEHLAGFLVHDEVEIALPVAGFLVGEPVEFLGQRPQRLHQQLDLLRADRQLTGLRPEQPALRPDDVAEVPGLEGLVASSGNGSLLEEDLDLAAAVLHLERSSTCP